MRPSDEFSISNMDNSTDSDSSNSNSHSEAHLRRLFESTEGDMHGFNGGNYELSRKERVNNLSSHQYQLENYLHTATTDLLEILRTKLDTFISLISNRSPSEDLLSSGNMPMDDRMLKGKLGALNGAISFIRYMLRGSIDLMTEFQKRIQKQLFGYENDSQSSKESSKTYAQYTYHVLTYLSEMISDILSKLRNFLTFGNALSVRKVSKTVGQTPFSPFLQSISESESNDEDAQDISSLKELHEKLRQRKEPSSETENERRPRASLRLAKSWEQIRSSLTDVLDLLNTAFKLNYEIDKASKECSQDNNTRTAFAHTDEIIVAGESLGVRIGMDTDSEKHLQFDSHLTATSSHESRSSTYKEIKSEFRHCDRPVDKFVPFPLKPSENEKPGSTSPEKYNTKFYGEKPSDRKSYHGKECHEQCFDENEELLLQMSGKEARNHCPTGEEEFRRAHRKSLPADFLQRDFQSAPSSCAETHLPRNVTVSNAADISSSNLTHRDRTAQDDIKKPLDDNVKNFASKLVDGVFPTTPDDGTKLSNNDTRIHASTLEDLIRPKRGDKKNPTDNSAFENAFGKLVDDVLCSVKDDSTKSSNENTEVHASKLGDNDILTKEGKRKPNSTVENSSSKVGDNFSCSARDDGKNSPPPCSRRSKGMSYANKTKDSTSDSSSSTSSEFSGFPYYPGPSGQSECRGFILLSKSYHEGSDTSKDIHCIISFDLTKFIEDIQVKMGKVLLRQENAETTPSSKEQSHMEIFNILVNSFQTSLRWNLKHHHHHSNKQQSKPPTRKTCECEQMPCVCKGNERSYPQDIVRYQDKPHITELQEVAEENTQLSAKVKIENCECIKIVCLCQTSSCQCVTKGVKCMCPFCNRKQKDGSLQESTNLMKTGHCKCGISPCRCATTSKAGSAAPSSDPQYRKAQNEQVKTLGLDKSSGKTSECKPTLCACKTEGNCRCVELGKSCMCSATPVEDTKERPTVPSCNCTSIPCHCTSRKICPCVRSRFVCQCSNGPTGKIKSLATEPVKTADRILRTIFESIILAVERLSCDLKQPIEKAMTEDLSKTAKKPMEVKQGMPCQMGEKYQQQQQHKPFLSKHHVTFDSKSSKDEQLHKMCKCCAEDIDFHLSDAQASFFTEHLQTSEYPEELYITAPQMLHPNHDRLPINVLEVREIVNGHLRVYTEDWTEKEEMETQGKFQSSWRKPEDCIHHTEKIAAGKNDTDSSFKIFYSVNGNLPRKVSSKTNVATSGLSIHHEPSEKPSAEKHTINSWPGGFPHSAKASKQIKSQTSVVSQSHFQNKVWIFHDDMSKAKYKEGPPLVLKLRRSKFLEEAFETLMCPSKIPLNYYREIRVYFKKDNGEVEDKDRSQDLFTLLSRQLFDPCNYQLFDKPSNDSSVLFLNPASPARPKVFQFAGVIFALSLMHRKQLGVKLPLAFFKCLLDRPFTVKDLDEVDPQLYQKVRWLQSTKLSQSNVQMTFTVKDKYGPHIYYKQLVPDGSSVLVTDANKAGFIELVVKWKLAERCFQQLKDFRRGLVTVLEPCILAAFTSEELQYLTARPPEEGPLENTNADNLHPKRRETW